MKHIILFDLDGTLTDPMEGITKSVQYALKAYGIIEEDLAKLCPFIGPPLTESFKEFYGFSDKEAREAISIFHEYFVKKGIYENQAYDGIKQMLKELKQAGFVLAVATSKPELFAEQILEYFDLRSYFELVGGSDMDEKIRVKKGDVIHYTLERLGCREIVDGKENGKRWYWKQHDKEELCSIMMVGDRKHDVIGAKETGIPCIGVLYGYGNKKELEEAGAVKVVESVEELKEVLLPLQ